MSTHSSTPTTIALEAHELVSTYLCLYESEGWPPEGFSGISPTDDAARHLLHELYVLRQPLWDTLPVTGSITVRSLMRRTSAAGPLTYRHAALRLGQCSNWFTIARATGMVMRCTWRTNDLLAASLTGSTT